jgi:hypothetical protein
MWKESVNYKRITLTTSRLQYQNCECKTCTDLSELPQSFTVSVCLCDCHLAAHWNPSNLIGCTDSVSCLPMSPDLSLLDVTLQSLVKDTVYMPMPNSIEVLNIPHSRANLIKMFMRFGLDYGWGIFCVMKRAHI